MSDSRFKTLRHIETVRNYMNEVIRILTWRQESHDQSKLRSPELEIFDKYTPLLRGVTYDSYEYRQYMKEMKVAIDHHNKVNSHHPEHFANGIKDMTLIHLIEMICDWKAASLRHDNGDILKIIEIGKKRFGYSDELASILRNTALILESSSVFNVAEES